MSLHRGAIHGEAGSAVHASDESVVDYLHRWRESTKPGPGWSTIAARGSANEGMVRGLAVGVKSIRINCISHGVTETEPCDSFGGRGKRQQIESL